MPLDITITPLSRIGGKDQPSLPGLMVAVPPRQAARGRSQDRLIVYLHLGGQAFLSSGDVIQAASRAAMAFYSTPGTLTSALRNAAGAVNGYLLDRNRSGPGQGQYAVGNLVLAVARGAQLTLLMSGPMQAFVLGPTGTRHIADSLSGRGLGLGNSTQHYFSQLDLHVGDRALFCNVLPSSWGPLLLDSSPASLDATRRRLMAASSEDLAAVLIQATEGDGAMHLQRTSAESEAVSPAATTDAPNAAWPPSPGVVQPPGADLGAGTAPNDGGLSAEAADVPGSEGAGGAPSAYAIPPQKIQEPPIPEGEFAAPPSYVAGGMDERPRTTLLTKPRMSAERQRQAARAVIAAVRGVQSARDRLFGGVRAMVPRLLPTTNQNPWSVGSSAMMFVAVLVPVVVVTIASAVYFRYGRSVQYEQYLVQSQDARAQALTLTDALAQREAWERELFYLDQAEAYSETAETRSLRLEAQENLDRVLGIDRLQFQPVLSRSLGVQIGRLAASENDVYLLDAQRGNVLHLALTNSGFQLDSSFDCGPGTYADYTVGPLVDILALPAINTLNATLLGVDALGNLLYCAPGQVARAVPLAAPDTNWGRIRAFALDSGNLYVLDGQARAVWVYVGEDQTFVDRPYFFFGGQIPELEDAIDLAVNADDLYVLHSDGRLSACSYSRIETVPTRCVDPAPLVNPIEAYREQDVFAQAHFTQLMFSPAPDASMLLLDADSQGIFRFAPRALELQSQMRPLTGRLNEMPAGEVTAMGISPNHVVYFALRDRIYFAAAAQ